MKLNNAPAKVLLPLIVAGLAVWLAMVHEARLERAKEHQTLELQWQQMAELAAANGQLSNRLAQLRAPKPLAPDELIELLHLRGEVSMQSRWQPELDRVRAENSQMHAALERSLKEITETNDKATADYWPQDSWTNAGYGSPDAAFETILWAGNNGDVTNFLASLADGAITNMGPDFNGKSEAEIAVRLEDTTYEIQSIRILGRETLDENTEVLSVELENQDGFQNVKMTMKREDGEWKFAGPHP